MLEKLGLCVDEKKNHVQNLLTPIGFAPKHDDLSPSAQRTSDVTEQGVHRFGAGHLTDCGWIASHQVHCVFHRKLRVGFYNLRLSTLRTIEKENR